MSTVPPSATHDEVTTETRPHAPVTAESLSRIVYPVRFIQYKMTVEHVIVDANGRVLHNDELLAAVNASARSETSQTEEGYANGYATALETAAQLVEGWNYPLLAADIRKLADGTPAASVVSASETPALSASSVPALLLKRIRRVMPSHGTHAEDAINAFEEIERLFSVSGSTPSATPPIDPLSPAAITAAAQEQKPDPIAELCKSIRNDIRLCDHGYIHITCGQCVAPWTRG